MKVHVVANKPGVSVDYDWDPQTGELKIATLTSTGVMVEILDGVQRPRLESLVGSLLINGWEVKVDPQFA